MRWRSWAAVAGQVAEAARRLAALDLPPGSPVAIGEGISGSSPDAVAAHLAIRATGHRPVPAGTEGPAVDLPGIDDPHNGRLSEVFERFEPAEDRDDEGAAAADLAGRLGAVPPPAKPPRGIGGRPVVVAWLDLGLPDHRTVLAWSLRSRAALALEPERRDLAATAAWSRATAIALPAEDLPLAAAHVRSAEEKRRKRRRWLGPLGRLGSDRRPMGGRLATVLALSSPAPPGGFRRLSGDEIGFWTERGVHLERVERT